VETGLPVSHESPTAGLEILERLRSMRRLGPIVRGMERSVLLALLALPILFSDLGAWKVWRGAAMRADWNALTPEGLPSLTSCPYLRQVNF
jgi:hypothetical protein